MKEGNLRKKVVTPDSGKDFRDTSVLTGTAPKNRAMNETNDTSQYTTGSASKGSLGGENTNS